MDTKITSAFFTANRQALAQALRGGVVAMSAYSQMQRGNDIAFMFEQESNFWYLTGIEHPDWWLIGDGTRGKWWLVAPELDEVKVAFDGMLKPEEAKEISGVDEVIDRSEALSLLRQLKRTHAMAYTCDQPPHAKQFGFTLNPAPKEIHDTLKRNFTKVQNCQPELAKLRAIKQPVEVAQIQRAIDLTTQAFKKVQQNFSTYQWEYQIEADFTHYFRSHGAQGHAYDPIVASAGNACTLHYLHNNDRLKKRSLVLMDIGARVGGYAADITRTFAYGELTKRQRTVHDAVRDVQEKTIQLCQPGASVETYLEHSNHIMAEAMASLGLIDPDKGDQDEKFRRYYPHLVSHGLGIDVHDSLGAPQVFKPGMVLTVEPGIYIPEENIGVRIEDNIHITSDGPVNLSQKLPGGL